MDYSIRNSWVKTHRPEEVPVIWEQITEQAYIPMRDQIRRFRAAGLNYMAWKGNVFDFRQNEEVTDEQLNTPIPTRAPNFDLADAVEIAAKARRNINAAVQIDKELRSKTTEPTPEEPIKDSEPNEELPE